MYVYTPLIQWLLPTDCIYVLPTILRIKTILSLNNITLLLFVMEAPCFSSELVNELLYRPTYVCTSKG
jgi:hypothetical protein